MASDSIYLAMDPRSGMHCLVRPVPVEDLGRPLDPVNPDDLNELLMARDATALIEAARKLGPMFSGLKTGDLDKKSFKPSELQGSGKLKVKLEAPEADRLINECFFDPYAEIIDGTDVGYAPSGRTAKSSAVTAAADLNFLNARDLSFADGHYRYLIEPLHDWVFARNLLSVVLRIGGLLRANPDDKDILSSAGFALSEPSTRHQRFMMEGTCYVIPIAFNPFYQKGNVVWNGLTFDERVIWPLYDSITEIAKSRVSKSIIDHHLKTEEKVKFLTSVEANRADGHIWLSRDKHDPVNRWWHMVLKAPDGESQLDIANTLLRGLDRSLFKPELAYTGSPMHEIEPAAKPTNLLEAMWLVVRNHPDRYLMTCDNCHRTVLSGTQGGERRFCSTSCRATWNRAHKEGR